MVIKDGQNTAICAILKIYENILNFHLTKFSLWVIMHSKGQRKSKSKNLKEAFILKISDSIESFIMELLGSRSSVELKRNELAAYFNCVPSQINYVIQTRFTTERGYTVESRRGGGGYVKITRVELSNSNLIEHILNSIGPTVDIMTVEAILNTLYVNGIIDADRVQIIMTACSGAALSAISDGNLRGRVRADIFKNLLLLFA